MSVTEASRNATVSRYDRGPRDGCRADQREKDGGVAVEKLGLAEQSCGASLMRFKLAIDFSFAKRQVASDPDSLAIEVAKFRDCGSRSAGDSGSEHRPGCLEAFCVLQSLKPD